MTDMRPLAHEKGVQVARLGEPGDGVLLLRPGEIEAELRSDVVIDRPMGRRAARRRRIARNRVRRSLRRWERFYAKHPHTEGAYLLLSLEDALATDRTFSKCRMPIGQWKRYCRAAEAKMAAEGLPGVRIVR